MRTVSSRPGESADAKPARTASASSGSRRPEERLDSSERAGRVVRHVGAVQRQEDLVVGAAHALQRQHLPADRDVPGEHAELQSLPSDRGLLLDRPPQQHLGCLQRLLGEHDGGRQA